MESAHGSKLKFALLDLPWAFVRLVGRLVRRCLVAVGVLVVLAVIAYVELETIVEFVDTHYAREIDDYLGIDATHASRGSRTQPISPSSPCSSAKTSGRSPASPRPNAAS